MWILYSQRRFVPITVEQVGSLRDEILAFFHVVVRAHHSHRAAGEFSRFHTARVCDDRPYYYYLFIYLFRAVSAIAHIKNSNIEQDKRRSAYSL